MKTGFLDRYVIERERNVIRVNFRQEPDPPAPKFPGAGALRNELPASPPSHPQPAKHSGGTMTNVLYALLMAGTLLIPHITPALGNESVVRVGGSRTDNGTTDWGTLLLVGELQRVPWLRFDRNWRWQTSALPIGPKLDTLEPFLPPPTSPSARFSADWKLEPQTTFRSPTHVPSMRVDEGTVGLGR